MWLLQGVAENGTDPLTFRVLPGSAKTMGRAVRADFVVEATLVSRLHCRVVATGTRLEVEDLDSTNGTFVNDRRVERAVLAPGDILRIGRVELTVVREG